MSKHVDQENTVATWESPPHQKLVIKVEIEIGFWQKGRSAGRLQMFSVKVSPSIKDFSIYSIQLLGWKKCFEKINTQTTCEFMVISQLIGGQF